MLASSSWRWPACAMLTVIGFPVAFGLLTVALKRWADWWNEFFELILLLAVLAAMMGFLSLASLVRAGGRDVDPSRVHVKPPRVHIEHYL
ncbi:hypothetical protein CC117_12000 [Parafrankia colletiae]|uniref:Uncharacterized protein n=1 Tax=Parafrankia colletiae TaxID=573497 RepID=A0A1S1R5Q1_9ACTN|nr:hypothetical protein CC117_12000 [Parafrankia colletiae]